MQQIMSNRFLFWNMDDLEAINIWQQLLLVGILEPVACHEAHLRNQTFSIELVFPTDNRCWQDCDEAKRFDV